MSTTRTGILGAIVAAALALGACSGGGPLSGGGHVHEQGQQGQRAGAPGGLPGGLGGAPPPTTTKAPSGARTLRPEDKVIAPEIVSAGVVPPGAQLHEWNYTVRGAGSVTQSFSGTTLEAVDAHLLANGWEYVGASKGSVSTKYRELSRGNQRVIIDQMPESVRVRLQYAARR